MAISPLRSRSMSPSELGTTTRTEKKALSTPPSQRPALRESLSLVDSFQAGGRPRTSPGGSSPSLGDTFVQGAATRTALDLLGGFGQQVITGLAGGVGELPSKLGGGEPKSELDPAGLQAAEPQLQPESESKVPMTADGRVIPQANDKRPEGDKRSAEQIVKDSPALASLGRQKDIKFDQLCKQTGVDPKLDVKDAKQNPDAVYRLSKVLEFIDASPASDGSARSGQVKDGKGDGNIEGLTKGGDARHGTEAGMVKDFAEKGYDFLQSQATLPTTKDTHVKKDGSNKDNFQWAAGEAAKKLFFIPGLSNVLSGIGNSKGGVGGAIEGALGGVVHTWKGAAEGVVDGLKKGKINPLQLGLEAYKGALSDGSETPDAVKDVLDKLP